MKLGEGMGKKNVPLGLKIIAVLFYIGAVLSVLFGFISFVLITFLSNGVFGTVFGIILFVFAVFLFLIGRGLWKKQNWARNAAIILSILGVIAGLSFLISVADIIADRVISIAFGIVCIVIYGLIGGYLWFNNNVKKAFGK